MTASFSGMFAIRSERDYVIDEDFMKATKPRQTIMSGTLVPEEAVASQSTMSRDCRSLFSVNPIQRTSSALIVLQCS